MRLYLITHAHTRQIRELDAAQWQLSDKGMQQAETLAAQPFWREVEQIVVSSEPKTLLTAEPAATRYNLPIHIDARFDELHRPGWVENYGERVRRAFAQPDQPAGDWEPASQALARFCEGMRELQSRFTGRNVALIGHGLTISLYRSWLLGHTHVMHEEWAGLDFGVYAIIDPERRHIIQDFPLERGRSARL